MLAGGEAFGLHARCGIDDPRPPLLVTHVHILEVGHAQSMLSSS